MPFGFCEIVRRRPAGDLIRTVAVCIPPPVTPKFTEAGDTPKTDGTCHETGTITSGKPGWFVRRVTVSS